MSRIHRVNSGEGDERDRPPHSVGPLSDKGGPKVGSSRQHHRRRMDGRIFPEASGHLLATG